MAKLVDEPVNVRVVEFAGDGAVWVHSGTKLRRWRFDEETPRLLEEFDFSSPEFVGDYLFDFDPDARQVLLIDRDTPRAQRKPWIQNLDNLESRELRSHGSYYWWCRVYHADGEVVISADKRGGILVGPATDEEPHLLLGHEGGIAHVAVSPDGRWIATGIRLRPSGRR